MRRSYSEQRKLPNLYQYNRMIQGYQNEVGIAKQHEHVGIVPQTGGSDEKTGKLWSFENNDIQPASCSKYVDTVMNSLQTN